MDLTFAAEELGWTGSRIARFSYTNKGDMPSQKHSVEQVQSSIEIDEAIQLHEKGWIIQRIGWVCIIGIMIAGILGLFGEGPLSKKNPVSGNIKATYERFFRYEAEMKIVMESSSDHISNISFPQHYLKNFKLIRFVPEPEQNITTANVVIYRFMPSLNRVVTIYLTPKNRGTIQGDMKVNGINNFSLHHYIYP